MINHALEVFEDLDVTILYRLLAFSGGLACVYLMQLTHYEAEDQVDPAWLRTLRRVSLAMLAIGMMWSIRVSALNHWAPWPPAVLIIAGLDLLIMVRILAIKSRIWRIGHYLSSPHQVDMIKAGDKR